LEAVCLSPLARGVAIDLDPARDPVTGSQNLRVLLAGRSGIYEYTAAFGELAAGTWRVINKGIEPSTHFAGAYWMGHVVFDPRPGMHHVVYASKSEDPVLPGAWRDDASCISRHSQARRPLYRSLDGGQGWSSLHGPEYLGIPEHLDVTVVAVSPKDGSLYVDGYRGLYVLPGVRTAK
jgi:hypothetical protein